MKLLDDSDLPVMWCSDLRNEELEAVSGHVIQGQHDRFKMKSWGKV